MSKLDEIFHVLCYQSDGRDFEVVCGLLPPEWAMREMGTAKG